MFGQDLPPLQTLRAFEAAARLGSFTDAANELAVTQGAVSQHIRNLEERLGLSLFLRTGSGIQATPDAHRLALQVRQGLRVLDRAFPPKSSFRRKPVPGPLERVHLVVSTLHAFATRWLAPRLVRFSSQHPDIDLDIRPNSALATLDHRDGVDVAIRYGPGVWARLQSEKLMDESVFPVVSPHYRSGSLPEEPRDLRNCTLLRLATQPWEPWFQAAGLDLDEPTTGPMFADPGLLLDAAATGQGVALARKALVQRELHERRLVRLWSASVDDIYAYYTVWRPDNTKQEAVAALTRWLQDEARTSAVQQRQQES
jgi:DNA-binding transcriptional LysR family regulator